MDIEQLTSKLSQQEKRDVMREELAMVSKKLQEERKILNRDWPHMAPRERSALSRQVKQLEEQQQVLVEEIEMNHAE